MNDRVKKTYYNNIVSGASVRDATGRLIHTTLDEALLLDNVVVEDESDESISSVKNKGSVLIVSDSVDYEQEQEQEQEHNPSLTLGTPDDLPTTSLNYLNEDNAQAPSLTYSNVDAPSLSYSNNLVPTPSLTEFHD